MESQMFSLDGVFSELSKCTTLLQSISRSTVKVCNPPNPIALGNEFPELEEAYAGLPTVCNSKRMIKQIEICLKSLQVVSEQVIPSVRPLLTRIELFGILTSCLNLFEVSSSIWKIMFTICDNSGRFLDASYALVNYALSKVFSHEENVSVYDILKSVRNEVLMVLQNSQEILESSHEACVTGRLPTPHAHFQSVIISLGRAYIEHYCDWSAFSARLDLIRLEHLEFFRGKSWASVCARGHFYWFHLHARCIFGANFEPPTTVDCSDTHQNFPPPSLSPLHAAAVVRMHGQTLVKFMRQCCEQKLQSRYTSDKNIKSSTVDEKENEDPASNHRKVKSSFSNSDMATTAWSSSLLTDNELLNLWLGTRLLLYGCRQTAELYTLLGVVKEARVYQYELLCIGQRFHLCSYAQVALNLMAHLDLFAQHRWAFELRLRQLNHIATCQVSLEEIVSKKLKQVPKTKSKVRSNPKGFSETDESGFIRSKAFPSMSLHSGDGGGMLPKGMSEEDFLSRDAISDGSNALLTDGHSKHFGSLFYASPTWRSYADKKDSANDIFPSAIQIGSVIAGKRLISDWNLWYKEGLYIPTSKDSTFEYVSSSFLSVGGLPLATCVCSILNGVTWPWLFVVTRLVRNDLLAVSHYLPALYTFAPKPTIPSTKACNQEENEANRSLIEAFSLLNGTPKEKTSDLCENKKEASPERNSQDSIHTGKYPLPRIPKPNAPRRLGDIYSKTDFRKCRSRAPSRLQAHEDIASVEIPVASFDNTTILSKIPVYCDNNATGTVNILDDEQSETAMLLRRLGLTPKKVDIPKTQKIPAVGPPVYKNIPNRRKIAKTKLTKDYVEDLDPVESCSSLVNAPLRPRSVKLTAKWEANQRKPTINDALCEENDLTPEFVDQMAPLVSSLASRLHEAYEQLSSFPIPVLLRPICQWLAIYWLGKNDHSQAGRFLCQSIGIGPTNFYLSILNSRVIHLKSADRQRSVSNPKKSFDWSPVFQSTRNMCAPNHPLKSNTEFGLPTHEEPATRDNQNSCIQIIQLCLVDEIGCRTSKLADEVDQVRNHQIVPFGLGARLTGYLLVSRYTNIVDGYLETCRVDSRIMHGFTRSGFKAIHRFEEIQRESLYSMGVEDRASYWNLRYSLDEKLENLLNEMRREWFTEDDLDWLFCRGKYSSSNESEKDCQPSYIVIIPDRAFNYLPWEWILWDREPGVSVPTMTRNFSLPIVIGQMRAHSMAGQIVKHDCSLDSVESKSAYSINPQRGFYIVNPESNLQSTQKTFESVFNKLSTWNGVAARAPTADEVNDGFTNHDIVIYLGHGNGSHFLLHTFNEGLIARAVALIIGCSSGRPHWCGRHEPYASVFNHIIAGCPFVCGLLWDVTDRDVDRFTLQFLMNWLGNKDSQNNDKELCDTLGSSIFRAISACKLKHLVGKSVIVYGIPVEPNKQLLLKFPSPLTIIK
ncbi:unnamed protein product [Trichobilharzia szidati]|nr:unnamed protein product [Trichobilharzia szidati]